MPVIHTYSSTPISVEQRDELKSSFGRAISLVPGKSETWLMCLFDENVPIYRSGSDAEPAAYVTVDVFARESPDPSAWQAMTEKITAELEKVLGIDPSRLYIKYGWSPDFGWNGSNF